MTDQPELLNASRDADVVNRCTQADSLPGGIQVVEHDYRPFTATEAYGQPTYLRCVWCHAVACGHVTQDDPCIEVWHHEPKDHRTAAGVTWPIGGNRPRSVA